MSKILLGVICLSILSCSVKRTDEASSNNKRLDYFEKKGITSDTCSFCFLDSFLIKSLDKDVQTKIVIDYPVAIEFFNRLEFVNKKVLGEGPSDTLKRKHDANLMNEMHHLQDQIGYYTQGIKPELLKNSVIIIDTLTTGQFIKLKNQDSTYAIDIGTYLQTDGVLMYTPGKKPIFWTMKKDKDHCFGYFGISKWYYNCH